MDKITNKISSLPNDANYISLEFFPPKTAMGFSNLQSRLERMAQALRPLFVTITWGAGGSTASKSLELAELCQRHLGLTTCLHLTCTNMDRSLIDEALEQAKVLGIRNILALRGDAPRSKEYREQGLSPEQDSNSKFTWAIDLVSYIRKQYGDHFCIGVAAYPEGHCDESYPEHQDSLFDLPYLVEKVKAGADFIMTQLFFDVEAYEKFETLLRQHDSGIFKTIPIIPGLMPIQSHTILLRAAKLSHAKLPAYISSRLEIVKSDDEMVKQVGIQILKEIINHIKAQPRRFPRGFHFFTLNLETTVSRVVGDTELNGLVPIASNDTIGNYATKPTTIIRSVSPPSWTSTYKRWQFSSESSSFCNIAKIPYFSGSELRDGLHEISGTKAGNSLTRINTVMNMQAVSEGECLLSREATWDDFPNGRWGDARSPAFGGIDGYGLYSNISMSRVLRLWGHPVERDDISELFKRHVKGDLEAIPWSEQGPSPETGTISKELVALNERGWWTVASQPAVNGVKSTDPVFGWGPKNGYVFQKPFVEFFIPSIQFTSLKARLDAHEYATYFAGNSKGQFEASQADSVNPVTWGTFAGKEIVTPTIIEGVSFKSWLDEAYNIWEAWRGLYPVKSATNQLLKEQIDDIWLVNIIWADYVEGHGLWEFLRIEGEA